ncbi:Dicer-like protein 1 [Penicillium canariense]|uniref:Dicer-like protein 1 n=1 Tax=Penicillium canariense TaxID=189055 RepID=A0A9W9LIN9_9EURO|nr:Dicer-like protein 1 [Penicillium canariense]KAJ5159977.1 Dicer-like protein 1 [Penicillium canariense]
MSPSDAWGEPRPSSSDESKGKLESKVAIMNHSRRQQIEDAQFEHLLTQYAQRDPSTIEKPEMSGSWDTQLNIARMLKKQDIGRGNLDPRVYQIELFERAKAENTIAVLDTGSGKTLIAVLLLKHILQQELIDREDGKAPRIAFFLAHSVTLVFQQTAVLQNNLNQNVAHIFGAMGSDLWDQNTWDDYFSKNMVIVCTGEILTQCLLNGFIKMSQINLLIFDEAHHTKKDHPYARIIRESYFKVDRTVRPRIFGMTASPVDGKAKMTEAAAQLELLLDSRIATTANLTLLRQFVNRPCEETWIHPKLDPPFKTKIFVELEENFGNMKELKYLFQFAWAATSELGKWCADQVWIQALKEDVIPQLESNAGKHPESDIHGTEQTGKDLASVREACEMLKNHPIQHPWEPGQLSPKVQLLLERLVQHFSASDRKKCIVFTERRNTAKALLRLCEVLNIPNLRPGILVGVRKSEITGNVTYRRQFEVRGNFQDGNINCLFATAVAEEGLDIPDCNLVVRFDLYNTLIQYIQSRGRARHANSTYAIMIEADNEIHKRRVQEVRDSEILMRSFCKTLPKDRLLRGPDYDVDLQTVLGRQKGKRTYTILSTGAKLTYGHAIDILGRYAASLKYQAKDKNRNQNPNQNPDCAHVSYAMVSNAEKFICEVILPEMSPIRGVIGALESSKAMAKGSAAFDTCMLLRKNNLLDGHFRPVYHRHLPTMRNTKLAIDSKNQHEYDRRCKPSLWTYQIGTIPILLYAIVICFSPSKPLTRTHANLILLTREQLPTFPRFPLYLDDDIETMIQTVCIESPIAVSSPQIASFNDFTVSVFRDVFHKTFDSVPETFPYWLAPARQDTDPIDPTELPTTIIDWKVLSFVEEHREWKWSEDMDPESLLERFLYDPWSGKYRYFPLLVDRNLRPSDTPPDHVPRRRDANMQNILNYSLSLGKEARSLFLDHCSWNQPVLQAEMVSLRRNFLDKASEEERSDHKLCVVCPEVVMLSAIPLSTVTSCLAFPAIISRIESYLTVREGCQHLGLDIRLDYALEAFTKDCDNAEEQGAEQSHVQRGMGKNYERLEFMGDTFLKMATSIALYCQRPDDNEYDYHVYRMCLICNKNLFDAATGILLYEYIRSRGFSRHTWFPTGPRLLHGRDFTKYLRSESSHKLAPKTIADVCEALIAAALLSGGKDHRFDMAVRAVTCFVRNDTLTVTHTATSWADYFSSYTKPVWQDNTPNGWELDTARQIFKKLGYQFKSPLLLCSAFTHSSVPHQRSRVPCYQRLEFLGDALLDMVCVEHLYHRFPQKNPQWLTEHKMAMVSNKFLGALAVHLGLHRHLNHADGPIQGQITRYAEEIQSAEAESDGIMDYWLHTKDSPKCLSDILEAYIAAIFVDSGFNYTVIEKFFNTHLLPYFVDMSLYDTFANRQPTTYLHHRLAQVYGCKHYCVKHGPIPTTSSEQPMILAAVMVHGVSLGETVGSSSEYARLRASEKALEALETLLPADFRLKFACDCKSADTEEEKKIDHLDLGTAE